LHSLHSRQPLVDGGCIPQKFSVAMAITIPQYGLLTGQPSGRQHNQIAPAYSEPIGLVTVDSTSSSVTSISKININWGEGVRPLDPLLGLRLWIPLGDFRPPGYLPLCVNPFPQSYRAFDATVHTVNIVSIRCLLSRQFAFARHETYRRTAGSKYRQSPALLSSRFFS